MWHKFLQLLSFHFSFFFLLPEYPPFKIQYLFKVFVLDGEDTEKIVKRRRAKEIILKKWECVCVFVEAANSI